MGDIDNTKGTEADGKGVSRREFVTGFGGVGLGAVLGGMIGQGFFTPEKVFAIPASEGYLVVDTTECTGCTTCMAACSMVHEGKVSLSLSRIQVLRNPLTSFPNDISQEQCRQCLYPACVQACPTGAMHVDGEHGNVRTVDESKCVGCQRCVNACPHAPGRALWNGADKHAQKCDLCTNTPHWNEHGGPGGKQACVEVCPASAIRFTRDIPVQNGEQGYNVDFYQDQAITRGWK